MTYPYSNDPTWEPPAPIIPIELTPCHDPLNRISEIALIDSGASSSAITKKIVEVLNLDPIREVTVRGVTGGKTLRVYAINLTFHNRIFPNMSVICLEDVAYPIIGRDILNNYYVHLKGPPLETEVT